MNSVIDNNVKPLHTDKYVHTLTDADLKSLKSYLKEQNRAVSDLTNHGQNDPDDTAMSLDIYVNKIIEKMGEPVLINHRHHHHHRRRHHHPPPLKSVYNHPTRSLPLDYGDTFDLEIATCGMQKNTKLPIPQENFSLDDGVFGDDAGFTLQRAQLNFLGISDGAGGNLMYGYDPRLFSESLMRNCLELAHTGKYSISEPKRLLCHAFDRVQTENCFGSATACVLGFDGRTARLHSVNIGDSGYVIVRRGYVVYRSQSQEMNGDCPRQLDVYPWTASLKGQGLNYTQISVFDAICQTFDLEVDDIIILSTDGLFDNASDFLIEQIMARSNSLQQAANELVTHAVRYYVKPDDILVIMARVTANNNCSYA